MNTRFDRIVNAQLAKAKGLPQIEYMGILFAAGVKVPVYKVMSLISMSNFQLELGTRLFVTLLVPTTHYRMLLTRAYGDITFKLLTKVGDKNLRSINYKGIVSVNKDIDMETPTMNQEGSGGQTAAIVHLELMEESLWSVRNRPVGNIYRDTDALSVCRAILADTMPSEAGDAGDASAVFYEDYVEESGETKKYEAIVIPDNVTFQYVFDILQNKFGIYPDGFGVFLYRKAWYIYRMYNGDKYQTSGQIRLNVYALPNEKVAHLEKTFVNDGQVRHIFVGSNTQAYDFQDAAALNTATGYRVGSVRALNSRTTSRDGGNDLYVTSDSFVSSVNQNEHKSGKQNAPVLPDRFKDDDKAVRSSLKQSAGQIVKITWTQSVLGLIYPGMPVKFMYSNEHGIYTRYGTIIGEVHQSAPDGGSMASPTYNSVTELTLWLSSETKEKV